MKQSPSEHAERWLAENRAALDIIRTYPEETPIAMQRKDSTAGKLFYTRIGDALAAIDCEVASSGCRVKYCSRSAP
mgnify:CR=1 FL=1